MEPAGTARMALQRQSPVFNFISFHDKVTSLLDEGKEVDVVFGY